MAFRRAMVAACVIGGVGGWNIANTGAAVEPLTQAYGVDTARIGVLTSILFLTQVVSQIPTGHLVDKIGAKRSAWACLALFGLGNLLACAAPEFWLGLVGRGLMGPAMALCFISGTAFIRGVGGTSFSQGVFGGASAGFGGLALAVVPLTTASLGWRAPYVGGIALAVLAVPLIAAAPRTASPPREGASPARALRLFKDRVLWKLGAIQTSAFGLNAVIANWVVLLVERNAAASVRVAGMIGALTLVGGTLSRPLGGLLVARHPNRTKLIVRCALAAGALATAALAVGSSIALAMGATLVVGLASGVPFGPTMELAGRSQPGSPGAAIGILNTGAILAIVVGTPAVGATFSLPGEGRLGFAIISLLWLASLPATSVFARRVDPADPP